LQFTDIGLLSCAVILSFHDVSS